MNAASPGVIALFFRNDHYASREEYVYAIADAMRVEYEAITNAGLQVQIDAPDLGMGRHIQFADKSIDEFRDEARLNIEALNHATQNIAPEAMRLHVCWGNYEGPHHCDVPFKDIIDLVFTARPAQHRVRGRQPAPRARVGDLRGHQAARRQDPDPGRPGVEGELHRAPGADRAAHPPLRRPGRRRERDGRQRLRLRHLGRPGRRRSRRRLGQAPRPQGRRGSRFKVSRSGWSSAT